MSARSCCSEHQPAATRQADHRPLPFPPAFLRTEVPRLAAGASRQRLASGTTKTPQTGSRTSLTAGCGRVGAETARRPSSTPRDSRQTARTTSEKQNDPEDRARPSASAAARLAWRIGRRAARPSGCALRRPSSACCARSAFRRSGASSTHPLPRLRRALEILLAERADDADVQQRLGVARIDRQRALELLRARDPAGSCSSRRCRGRCSR